MKNPLTILHLYRRERDREAEGYLLFRSTFFDITVRVFSRSSDCEMVNFVMSFGEEEGPLALCRECACKCVCCHHSMGCSCHSVRDKQIILYRPNGNRNLIRKRFLRMQSKCCWRRGEAKGRRKVPRKIFFRV